MNQKPLVVDDDPITGVLMASLGRAADFDTCCVTAAAAFRKGVDELDPTAVAIDILMPDEDGITLLRWLASRRKRPAVILISAYAVSYLPAARRLGEAYGLRILAALPKPIDPRRLDAALRAAAA